MLVRLVEPVYQSLRFTNFGSYIAWAEPGISQTIERICDASSDENLLRTSAWGTQGTVGAWADNLKKDVCQGNRPLNKGRLSLLSSLSNNQVAYWRFSHYIDETDARNWAHASVASLRKKHNLPIVGDRIYVGALVLIRKWRCGPR